MLWIYHIMSSLWSLTSTLAIVNSAKKQLSWVHSACDTSFQDPTSSVGPTSSGVRTAATCWSFSYSYVPLWTELLRVHTDSSCVILFLGAFPLLFSLPPSSHSLALEKIFYAFSSSRSVNLTVFVSCVPLNLLVFKTVFCQLTEDGFSLMCISCLIFLIILIALLNPGSNVRILQ